MNTKLKTNCTVTPLNLLAIALLLMPVIGWSAVITDSNSGVEPAVVERGPHYRVWERVVEVPTAKRTVKQVHRYTELASGMHYQNPNAPGQWLESREVIDIVNGFGVATQGQCQAIFAPNLNSEGAIDLLTPDGRFRSTVLGIAFTSPSGRSILIGETTNSVGQLVEPNVVLYPSAIVGDGGVRCDVRYTYKCGSFEQEVLIRTQLPSPADYGLEAGSRLEIWTEFQESPTPAISTRLLKPVAVTPDTKALDPQFSDDTMEFGAVRIGLGTAFALTQDADSFDDPPALVAKEWTMIDSRQFLVEKVELADIAVQLAKLPKTAALRSPAVNPSGGSPALRSRPGTIPQSLLAGQAKAWTTNRPALRPRGEVLISVAKSAADKRTPAKRTPQDRASLKEHASVQAPRSLPGQADGWSTNEAIQVAHLAKREPGVSIDYSTAVSQTNFTFQGDSTYFIAGQVNLSGTTILEGGCVIKNTNGTGSARIVLQGPLDCRTSPMKPAIFTGKNDNSVGDIISGSSGNPTTNYFGEYLVLNGNTNAIDLHDVRIRYAYYGVYDSSGPPLTNSHSQFTGCYVAVAFDYNGVWLRNVLIHDGNHAFAGGSDTNWHGENLTCHRLYDLRNSGSMLLTNSLMISATNRVNYTGLDVISNLDDTGIFQTAGFGSHYLADASPYRDAATNVGSALANDLKLRTTWPPVVLTNDISLSTVFSPMVQRDTDTVDLGYHYDAVDAILAGVTVTNGAVLLVTNGTVIAFDLSSAPFGIKIAPGSQIISQGTPTRMNCFVRTHAVQEGLSAPPVSLAPNFACGLTAVGGLNALFHFTDFPMQSGGYWQFYSDHSQWCYDQFLLQDCQVRGGLIAMSPILSSQSITWINNLFERVGTDIYPYAFMNLTAQNDLFEGGSLTLNSTSGSYPWAFHYNVFDQTALVQGPLTNYGWNVFVGTNGFLPDSSNNVILGASPAFQVGPLGRYYLATNSPLIDASGGAGTYLAHHTMTTNQAPDLTPLDLGFHYVALDALGNPVDTDGDGIPDYLEDVREDLFYDNEIGESDWQTYNSPNKLTGAPGLQVYTPLK